jgi:epoxyqueuosine reductase QueG
MEGISMNEKELTRHAKSAALSNGADLVGVVRVADLPEHRERIDRMLPGAQSVLVLASGHSLASLRSGANELAQFDTIHAYTESARAANVSARSLESNGFLSAGVPAFIPLDMEEPGKGMRGEICWRRAGVRAGMGSYGESGALVTKEYGQAVRLSGVITTASLFADEIREILRGSGLRQLWQTFMTGNYYYCFKCQAQCPATRLPVEK